MNDKSNKEFWDKFAKLYAPFMRKDKGVYDKVCEYICSYLNKDMNALELACGSGQLSLSLSKYTKNWIGTDFSEQMILEARKHGEYENLAFEIADATSLNIEIYRVLKPNGILFAPTFLWKEGKQSKFKKWLMSVAGFKMYQEWNKKQFKDFIEKHGFSVVEMNLIHGGLAPIGVMIAYKK